MSTVAIEPTMMTMAVMMAFMDMQSLLRLAGAGWHFSPKGNLILTLDFTFPRIYAPRMRDPADQEGRSVGAYRYSRRCRAASSAPVAMIGRGASGACFC